MQTEVLAIIFSQPHGEFLSSWCSRPSEEDATLDFDSLAAAGWVLGLVSSDVPESTFNACRVPRSSYAFQRTSLLVKVAANLTCFIPDICKEEKDLFLRTFLHCFHKELLNMPYGVLNDVRAERAAVITQNLGSLLIHAASLTPAFLNQDDVQLFKMSWNWTWKSHRWGQELHSSSKPKAISTFTNSRSFGIPTGMHADLQNYHISQEGGYRVKNNEHHNRDSFDYSVDADHDSSTH
nr:nodulin homeobox [Tanacetum cinerariifolium]